MNLIIIVCTLLYMGVKLHLSQWGKNTGWRCR